MTAPQTMGLSAAVLTLYFGVAYSMAAKTPIMPRHEVAPRMDVLAPASCAKTMQELNLKHGIDVTVNMDTFIMIRRKLQDCGGDIVEESN